MLSNAILVRWLRRRGYSNIAARHSAATLKKDLGYRQQIGWPILREAWSRGFSAAFYFKLRQAGIDPVECMPDLHCWKMHPINGNRFGMWIDDKLTIRYVLSEFAPHLPEYYCYCSKGSVYPLMDYPKKLLADGAGVVTLLRETRELAVKKRAGSVSVGFYKLESKDDRYLINGDEHSERDLRAFIDSLDDYLITEYLHSCSFLKRFHERSPNIVRLVVVNNNGIDPEPIAAYLRVGQDSTGFTELTSSGGIFVGIGLENGDLFGAREFAGPVVEHVSMHPNSLVPLEGTLPGWREMIDGVLRICRYVPNLRYLGFDLIVTESSFKIIEINSMPGVTYMQIFHPYFRSQAARKLFRDDCSGLTRSRWH